MIIKIYGERNTGTNYLESLIKKHMKVLAEKGSAFKISSICASTDLQELGDLGWKHRLASAGFLQERGFQRESILIVTLTKNPYSWLLSLHKRPYNPIHSRANVITVDENNEPRRHTVRNIKIIRRVRKLGRLGQLFLSHFPQWSEYEKISFSDFIRSKWFVQFDEGYDKIFKNPVKLWNKKNKAYIELAKHYNVLSFTYEELLESPEVVIRTICHRAGVELEEFNNVSSAAKKEDVSSKDNAFYRDYYLNERWREQLTSKEVKWISSQLDTSVMKSFGYQLL